MQTSVGVVSLWIQFAAVLVAVQCSLSVACLMSGLGEAKWKCIGAIENIKQL